MSMSGNAAHRAVFHVKIRKHILKHRSFYCQSAHFIVNKHVCTVVMHYGVSAIQRVIPEERNS